MNLPSPPFNPFGSGWQHENPFIAPYLHVAPVVGFVALLFTGLYAVFERDAYPAVANCAWNSFLMGVLAQAFYALVLLFYLGVTH